jgi:hypothetical protein
VCCHAFHFKFVGRPQLLQSNFIHLSIHLCSAAGGNRIALFRTGKSSTLSRKPSTGLSSSICSRKTYNRRDIHSPGSLFTECFLIRGLLLLRLRAVSLIVIGGVWEREGLVWAGQGQGRSVCALRHLPGTAIHGRTATGSLAPSLLAFRSFSLQLYCKRSNADIQPAPNKSLQSLPHHAVASMPSDGSTSSTSAVPVCIRLLEPQYSCSSVLKSTGPKI